MSLPELDFLPSDGFSDCLVGLIRWGFISMFRSANLLSVFLGLDWFLLTFSCFSYFFCLFIF